MNQRMQRTVTKDIPGPKLTPSCMPRYESTTVNIRRTVLMSAEESYAHKLNAKQVLGSHSARQAFQNIEASIPRHEIFESKWHSCV